MGSNGHFISRGDFGDAHKNNVFRYFKNLNKILAPFLIPKLWMRHKQVKTTRKKKAIQVTNLSQGVGEFFCGDLNNTNADKILVLTTILSLMIVKSKGGRRN